MSKINDLSSAFSGPSSSKDPDVRTFRPRTGMFTCILWGVAAVAWIFFAIRDGLSDLFLQMSVLALISTVIYATCGRPVVAVQDSGVFLRNVFKDITIPWSQLAEVGTQYALTLVTKDGQKIQAWAAPASGRFGAAKVTQDDLKALQWDEAAGPLPSSASLRSDSGAAAAIIRINWAKAKENGFANETESADQSKVQSTWYMPVVILAAVSAGATALAIVLKTI